MTSPDPAALLPRYCEVCRIRLRYRNANVTKGTRALGPVTMGQGLRGEGRFCSRKCEKEGARG